MISMVTEPQLVQVVRSKPTVVVTTVCSCKHFFCRRVLLMPHVSTPQANL